MSEQFSKQYGEDAVARTNDMLQREHDTVLDGDFAAGQVRRHVVSTEQAFRDALQQAPSNTQGFYELVGRNTSANNETGYFKSVAAMLAGRIVLVPAAMANMQDKALFPAVVSEQGLATQEIRLHILKRPYRVGQGLGDSGHVFLSAAGQAETAGIGDHDRTASVGMDPEHFNGLLAVGGDMAKLTDGSGAHLTHGWRGANQSVIGITAERLYSNDAPQVTRTITEAMARQGAAALYWHDSLGGEVADQTDALVVVQAVGFTALRQQRPQAINTMLRSLS